LFNALVQTSTGSQMNLWTSSNHLTVTEHECIQTLGGTCWRGIQLPYDASTRAEDIDSFVWNNPDIVICFAAGNDYDPNLTSGCYRKPPTMFTTIAVADPP